MKSQVSKLLVVVLVTIFLFYIWLNPQIVGLNMLGIGYLSGTQGLEPTFDSVKWKGAYWSTNETGLPTHDTAAPSSMSFGYSMVFDPDEPLEAMPDMCGSQQPMTVQTDTEPKKYSWQISNGTKTFDNGTIADVYTQFDMYRYKCDWAINVWLSGTEKEADGAMNRFWYPYVVTPDYAGAELWLRLQPRSFVYFTDNPDEVYFAPAYIGLAENAHWVGINRDGQKVDPDPQIVSSQDIIPKAQGETVGIYYQRGGGSVISEDVLLSYQNHNLDPEIFRNDYWMRLNLMSFKPLSWEEWLVYHNWKYPSAYLHFTVYLFVVGQWTVYFKTGEIPKLEPHTPVVNLASPFDALLSWLSNPLNQLWTFFIVIVIVVVGISILNPGMWTAIALSRKKK